MTKHISRSLSLQLLCGVLLSLMAAGVVYFVTLWGSGQILNHTVYSRAFERKMADQKFELLQLYVDQEQITQENLSRLNVWCKRGRKVYLTIYEDTRILYESPDSRGKSVPLNPEDFDAELENPDREYALKLSDGTTLRAFLYYYAGDAYYFWTTTAAAALAILTFSLCFVSLIHKKISYIMQLKQELDVLAGGNMDCPVSVQGEDEISELAQGIDHMRRSIVAHQHTEEQIRMANSQLVTAMSHDLRTPLTSLLAYLELMDRGKYEDEEQLRYFIDRCLEKTLRIKSMADKLFEYILVYASEWEQPKMEPVDADETIQHFWGEYAFSLENSGFTVEQAFSQLEGTVTVNMDYLHRAFDNLYSNLLKYADPKQSIRISCRREDGSAVLTISNGICPENDASQSTNIGLNTCNRILESLGGTFETQEDGQQFRVKVTLPIKEKTA